MKRKYLSCTLIASGFILLFLSVFSLGTSNSDFHQGNKSEDGWHQPTYSPSPISLTTILEESIEIPGYQTGLKLIGSITDSWIPFHLDSRISAVLSAKFKKSLPLFDVRQTYIHFFYPW
ncbi:hypothetical protein JYB64_07685 [Algoriphagus aestuarii]|nr:hypothetical protein [Algoriphagus aestuarii]